MYHESFRDHEADALSDCDGCRTCCGRRRVLRLRGASLSCALGGSPLVSNCSSQSYALTEKPQGKIRHATQLLSKQTPKDTRVVSTHPLEAIVDMVMMRETIAYILC